VYTESFAGGQFGLSPAALSVNDVGIVLLEKTTVIPDTVFVHVAFREYAVPSVGTTDDATAPFGADLIISTPFVADSTVPMLEG
jgi:hypothetical protein